MCVLCSLYLKDLSEVDPVRVWGLPWCAIRQALTENIQIEDGIVFWVLDFTLEQFHDAQEGLQGAADVYNCRHNDNNKRDFYLYF